LLAAFRLAFYFHRPVSELNISFREFLLWLEYLRIEPPDKSANERTASLMAQITNMAGRSLPDRKTMSMRDFLPQKPQTPMEQKAMFMALTGSKPNGR